MAGEAMTSKAILDADASGFIGGMGKAQSATKGLEDQMSRLGKVVTGFGVLNVVSQIRGLVSMVKGSIDALERDAVARVARLAGETAGASGQSVAFRREAAEKRIEAGGFQHPVSLFGKGVRAVGSTLAAGALELTGFHSAAVELATQTQEMVGHMRDAGAGLDRLADDADSTAANLERVSQMTREQANTLSAVLDRQGFSDEARRLGELAAGDNFAATRRAMQDYHEAMRSRLRDRNYLEGLGD